MVAIASAQMRPYQCDSTPDRLKLNTRTKAANTAALVVTDMKAVTGVGAPSYTSGVHMWNGTIETLKAKPTTISPMPTNSKGLEATLEAQPRPCKQKLMTRSWVEPVAPYTSAMPY